MLRIALAALPLLVVTGCAVGDTTSGPSETATVSADGLTVTRDGADTYEFHDAVAECFMSEAGTGDVEVVRLTAPADYRRVFREGRLREPFLYVEAIPGVEGRRELPLQGRNFDEGPPDVVVFGADPQGRNNLSGAVNNVSGAVEVASGYIAIIEATCDPEPRMAFTIRANLGSEYSDGRSVHVWGGLEAAPPPG